MIAKLLGSSGDFLGQALPAFDAEQPAEHGVAQHRKACLAPELALTTRRRTARLRDRRSDACEAVHLVVVFGHEPEVVGDTLVARKLGERIERGLGEARNAERRATLAEALRIRLDVEHVTAHRAVRRAVENGANRARERLVVEHAAVEETIRLRVVEPTPHAKLGVRFRLQVALRRNDDRREGRRETRRDARERRERGDSGVRRRHYR